MLGKKYARYREETEVISPIRKKLTYSNVIASLALFVALGGVAVPPACRRTASAPSS